MRDYAKNWVLLCFETMGANEAQLENEGVLLDDDAYLNEWLITIEFDFKSMYEKFDKERPKL